MVSAPFIVPPLKVRAPRDAGSDLSALPQNVFASPLQDLCITVVAGNFESSPGFGPLPEKYIKKVVDILPIDLPIELAGTVRGRPR